MSRGLAILCLAGIALCAAPDSQRSKLDEAWALIGKGQRTEAVELLRRTVKDDPDNADARLLLGSVLMEAGERAECISNLSAAVRLRPGSAEAHNALGEAYNAFGDSKSARPEFEKAIALDPQFAQAQVSLASVLLQSGQTDPAKDLLDRAIKILGNKPDAAYAYYLRAKTFSEGRDYARAAADLEQSVNLQPDSAEAWSELGEARKQLSDDAGAVTALRRAVELAPDDSVARARLGSRLLDTGHAQEAVEHLRHAVSLDPNNQSALNALMAALRKSGQKEEADAVKGRLTQLLRQKDKADQNLVAAIELNNRGAELGKKGDVRGALEKYRAALAIYPDHVGIRINVAVALLKLGQWDEGIAQMREALKRDPSNTVLAKALEDALAQARAHGIVLSQP